MPIDAWKQKKRIPTDQNIPCFTAGTLIAKRDGQKRIDDLRPGDHVITGILILFKFRPLANKVIPVPKSA